jgi:ABC-2 type transport system permease protein
MTGILVRKLLRDVRVALILVAVLLCAFQCLWARVTERISGDLIPSFAPFMSVEDIRERIFKGPGRIMQTLMGGADIRFERAADMLSIGYVHPLVQVIFCVWAIGRAAGGIAGEIDRGTMELLLAQPLPRRRVILAHLCVDLLTIPVLCLSVWIGTWLGAWMTGLIDNPLETKNVNPWYFGPSLLNAAVLLFAVSGYTLALSAGGRFRWRVMGAAVLLTLLQFLVNVIGQIWDAAEPLRPFTVFYYYQPQAIILHPDRWLADAAVWWRLGVLLVVGAVGYVAALVIFSRRDLPAPL